MAKGKKAASKSRKKPIEQYDHKGKKRVNNPPVGLVTPATDKESGKKTYAYDPHLDPQLVWAGKADFVRSANDFAARARAHRPAHHRRSGVPAQRTGGPIAFVFALPSTDCIMSRECRL